MHLAGQVVMSLLQGRGSPHARLLLSLEQASDKERLVERIIAVHQASMEALERASGAPWNSLARADATAVKVWADALGEEGRAASWTGRRHPDPTPISASRITADSSRQKAGQ